jgi:N4-gp56 family major capsid protein
MTTTNTGTSNFDKRVQELIRKELEAELLPSLPHLNGALGFIKARFVAGSNSTMRFLRVPHLTVTTNSGTVSAGTAPWLTEGTSPTAQALSFGYEEFTAYQAGQRVELTDLAMDEVPEVASEAAVRIARQAHATIDEYVGRILAAGTSVIYAGSGNTARTDVGITDTLTGSLLRRAAQGMKLDNIPMFGDGTFHAVINPAVVFDFEEDESLGGWKAIGTYSDGQSGNIAAGVMGKYAGVSFIESSNARSFAAGGAGGADVYSTYICGPDSYAFGDWGDVSTHVVLPGGHGDELAQVMSIGWKCRLGAMLVDEAGARYVRIESGATSI